MKSLVLSLALNNAIVSFKIPRTQALGRQWTCGHRVCVEYGAEASRPPAAPQHHSAGIAVSAVMFGIYQEKDGQVVVW